MDFVLFSEQAGGAGARDWVPEERRQGLPTEPRQVGGAWKGESPPGTINRC